MAGIVKDDLGRVRSGWVLLAFAGIATPAYLLSTVVASVLGLYPRSSMRLDDWGLLGSSMAMLICAATASLACKLFFKAEVGLFPPVGRSLAIGAAAGIAAVSAACLGALGGGAELRLGGAGFAATAGAGLMQLAVIGPTSVGEELLLRGVVLRQLARGFSPLVAVLLTGLTFGVMHAWNPSSSVVAAVNIALVGVWFGALVWRTGSLWTSIALHVVWNWFEGFVFGTPVSGIWPAASLLVVKPGSAAVLWTGGDFGPEASGVTTLVLLLACAATFFCPATGKPDSSRPAPGTGG